MDTKGSKVPPYSNSPILFFAFAAKFRSDGRIAAVVTDGQRPVRAEIDDELTQLDAELL